MEGYVRLKASFGFNTVWLVLDGQDLAYYESLDLKTQAPKKLKGVLNVRDGILKKFQQSNMQMGIKIKNKKATQKLSFDCPSAAAWNSWFNALNRAIKEHIEEEKKLQLPYDYRKVLEIDSDIPKLSKSIITRAYKKISLREHPDKGGNADTFSKITEAYSYLINYQAEMDARENMEIVQYEAIVEKANGVGLGIHLVEDKLREQFVVTQIEESIVIHGLTAEAQGEIRINDALISIDQDEISHWYFSRLKARLDTSRLPFGSKVLLIFERRVPKDEDGQDVMSNYSSLPSSPAHSPLRTRPTSTADAPISSNQQESNNSNSSSTTRPMPSNFSFENATTSEKQDDRNDNDTDSAKVPSSPVILMMPPVDDTPTTPPPYSSSSVSSSNNNNNNNSSNNSNGNSNAVATRRASTAFVPTDMDVPSTNTTYSGSIDLPATNNDGEEEENEEDDDDDDDSNEEDDDDDEEEEENMPKIAHEDVLEVLQELETARSLNTTLQAQNEELSQHCESLSLSLRQQEEHVHTQEDSIRLLKEENERLQHENSTMRGLLLHDQFPQTAEKMKEYLLLLQKEVIGLRTQLKQFDPYLLSPQHFQGMSPKKQYMNDEEEMNYYANMLLAQQQYQVSSANKKPSSSAAGTPKSASRVSRSRSSSATKLRPSPASSSSRNFQANNSNQSMLSAFHLSEESKQQRDSATGLLSPLGNNGRNQYTNSFAANTTTTGSGGVQQVYRQREERAKTVEIKLRDLLNQATSTSSNVNVRNNNHDGFNNTASSSGDPGQQMVQREDVQRRLSKALGHDQQYHAHQSGLLNHQSPSASSSASGTKKLNKSNERS